MLKPRESLNTHRSPYKESPLTKGNDNTNNKLANIAIAVVLVMLLLCILLALKIGYNY